MAMSRTSKKEINMLNEELIAFLDEPEVLSQDELETLIEKTVRTLEDCSYHIQKLEG